MPVLEIVMLALSTAFLSMDHSVKVTLELGLDGSRKLRKTWKEKAFFSLGTVIKRMGLCLPLRLREVFLRARMPKSLRALDSEIDAWKGAPTL